MPPHLPLKPPLPTSGFLNPHTTSQCLRSASLYSLHQPRIKLSTMEDKAFQVAAPHLWNALPKSLRAPQNVEMFFFKSLKTFLFKKDCFYCTMFFHFLFMNVIICVFNIYFCSTLRFEFPEM